jgi:hypothetical protein
MVMWAQSSFVWKQPVYVRMIAAAGVVLAHMVGCATWHAPETYQEWKLPAPDVGEDSVIFEFAFVRLPGESLGKLNEALPGTDSFWQSLDEQFLSAELRQHLSANGLRVGEISDPLPDSIRIALEATRDPLTVITHENATPGAEILTRREKRQCSSGSLEEVEVLPLRVESRVVLLHEQGRVRAQQFEKPRGFFQLTTKALGDGRVSIELVPVIDFGDPRERILGGQGAYRYDTRRDKQSYDSLKISAALVPGRTLVVTCMSDSKGLGATFFADRFDGSSDQLLMLLRISQSNRDELFSPLSQSDSIVTPLK